MRLLRGLLLIVGMMFVAAGCDNQEWDATPQVIKEFVAQYYPEGEVQSCVKSPDGYTVTMSGGPMLKFDVKRRWTEVDGRGVVLPTNFIFNEMPSAIYDYLEELEQVGGVYKAQRTSAEYTLLLDQATITYNVASRQLSEHF